MPLFSTTEKIYLTFYDTNNYKNGKYNSCTASIFNETYILRRECSFPIYTEKERKKKFEFEQSSWRHKILLIKVICLIDNSKFEFEYYIIQQLFNDVNVPRCHTENLSYENIFFPFKYTSLLYSRFYFLDTNIKGTIFSGRVRSHTSQPPQLRACLISYTANEVTLVWISFHLSIIKRLVLAMQIFTSCPSLWIFDVYMKS